MGKEGNEEEWIGQTKTFIFTGTGRARVGEGASESKEWRLKRKGRPKMVNKSREGGREVGSVRGRIEVEVRWPWRGSEEKGRPEIERKELWLEGGKEVRSAG